MKSINFKAYSKQDIENIIKTELEKRDKNIYYQLDKLRNQIIDLNDIIRILKR